jgi:nickel-dependent lactate racemase
MRVGLDWGHHHLDVDVPAESVVDVRRATPAPALSDPAAALRNVLEVPLDFPPLRRALTPDDQIAIVVDEQIPQLPRLLIPLLEHIRAAHVSAETITLLCLPPSAHQPWLDELPDEFQDVRVEVHQPADRRKLSYLATTRQGRRVYLNRSAVDADQLILLTRRTYDPLLGYGGAEGALYPGLSDEATLRELATQLHAEAPGGEPWAVQREAGEVAWLLGAPFLIQVIEGVGNEIAHVLAGTVESSREGERWLDARWRMRVDRPADIVVATLGGDAARLHSRDLGRAFFSAARVVKPGGRIVLLTDASPELGRSFDVLRQRGDVDAAMESLMKERPADLAAGFMWATAAQDARLYLLSGLPADVAEELFTTPLQGSAEVQRLLGNETSCLFIADANKALPLLEAPA